jgi:hypothetical protein
LDLSLLIIKEDELFDPNGKLIRGAAKRLIGERIKGKTGLLTLRDIQGRGKYEEDRYLWEIISAAVGLMRSDRFGAKDLRIFLPMLPDQKADKNWPEETRVEVLRRDHGKINDYQTLPFLLVPHGVTEIVSLYAHPRHLRPSHPGSSEEISPEYLGDRKKLTLRSIALGDSYTDFVREYLRDMNPQVISPEKPGGAGVRLAIEFARSLELPYHQVIKTGDETGFVECETYDAEGKDLIIIDDFAKSLGSVFDLLENTRNPGRILLCFYHFDLTKEAMKRFYSLMAGIEVDGYGHLPIPEGVITTNSLKGEVFANPYVFQYDIVPNVVDYYLG